MLRTDKAFEQVVDVEYMTQVEHAGFDAVFDGVKLALLVCKLLDNLPLLGVFPLDDNPLETQAMGLLDTFGNLQGMRAAGLSEDRIQRLYQLNYSDGKSEESDEHGLLEWKLQYDADRTRSG